MQRLADGEIASNNGGWQWSAGTGTDAAPVFPHPESVVADEALRSRRRLHQALGARAARRARRPILRTATPGIPLAKGYPLPMVDHHTERDVALEMYRK